MAETSFTIASGDVDLEALLVTPNGAAPHPAIVVCHPHPQYGGSMHSNAVAAIAAGALSCGIAAVLFNFRGVGVSGGTAGNIDEARADVRAVLDAAAALEDLDEVRIALAGYSFGAGAAAGVLDASLPAVVLVSLPTSMTEDIRGIASAYPGPALLISGDRDEVSAESGLRAFAAASSGDARVEMVAGADHFWRGHERTIADTVAEFLAPALGVEGT
jgi:hypothetical protein